MPAKGSETPASVKHGSPRESWNSEPSDLVQLGEAVVIVTGVPNAGSVAASTRSPVGHERYSGRPNRGVRMPCPTLATNEKWGPSRRGDFDHNSSRGTPLQTVVSL